MKKQGQWYEKIGDNEKRVLKENNIEIKKINKEIERLFFHKLDTSGMIRKELSKERRRLNIQNTNIRKGFIKIGNNDDNCVCGRLKFNNKCLHCDN